jgi:hypothetical protein
MNVNSKNDATPRPAANQNNACQLKCSAIAAESGSPSAPPTPSEALIKPIAVPTRSAGTVARSTLMPSGMIGNASPCRPRPTTKGISELVVAAISDPAVSTTAHTMRTGLGPYMSPSRPNTGVATAAVNNVAVMAHDALDGLAFSSFGSSGINGMMSVCIKDTLMPAADSTATRIPG